MRKILPAIALSLALSLGLVSGLAFAVPGEGTAPIGSADASQALVAQAGKTPKITVKRAVRGEVGIKKGTTYKLGAETTADGTLFKVSKAEEGQPYKD